MIKKKPKKLSRKYDEDSERCRGACFNMVNNSDFWNNWQRPLQAEFWGTTFFVFLSSMGPASGELLINAVVNGLAFLLVAWQAVSGGHFNPVITLAAMLSGTLGVFKGLAYMTLQVVGGIAGAAITRGVLPEPVYDSIQGGTPTLGPVTSPLVGLAVEAILTTILVLIYIMVNMEFGYSDGSSAHGAVYVVAVIAGGPLTGGSINPVIAMGPAIMRSFDSDAQWTAFWIYWIGPILGSLLAVYIYRFFLAGSDHHVRLGHGFQKDFKESFKKMKPHVDE